MNEQQKQDFKIINGDSLKVLDTIEENSIDAIITDPPYELGFMGKGWDKTGIAYNVELWQKALRVLKPGGYLLAFGGTRTVHRIACAIEDAGFEIRDTIMWLYGSGFPKSLNIGLAIDKRNGVESEVVGQQTVPDIRGDAFGTMNEKQNGSYKMINRDMKKATNEWAGWGTCLKPSYEPIIVARKPFSGSLVDNVLEYRVGGLNIDECRVGNDTISIHNAPKGTFAGGEYGRGSDTESYRDSIGRFPANTILTYDESDFDEVCGGMPNTKSNGSEANYQFANQDNPCHLYTNVKSGLHYEDEGSASRYFYCAKATKKDRDDGLINFENVSGATITGRKEGSKGIRMANGKQNPFAGKASPYNKNIHPTVKPVELMQYLVRLVSPKGATILDIFNGSGSTGKAVAFENRERDAHYKYIGIELDKEYCAISESRIDYALNKFEYDILEDIKESNDNGEINLFEFL